MLVSSNKSKTERLDPIVNNTLVNDSHFKNDWFDHFVRDSGQVIHVNIHLPETIILFPYTSPFHLLGPPHYVVLYIWQCWAIEYVRVQSNQTIIHTLQSFNVLSNQSLDHGCKAYFNVRSEEVAATHSSMH
jgi:hypothetical protein